ncbi:TPA: hypothetical protein HIE95_003884 [Escherichia coli]|nr:hypothetical protein [Escherichia coli]
MICFKIVVPVKLSRVWSLVREVQISVPLLFMAFPGVPLAGRAVVNGASEAVSALAGFHP